MLSWLKCRSRWLTKATLAPGGSISAKAQVQPHPDVHRIGSTHLNQQIPRAARINWPEVSLVDASWIKIRRLY